MQISVNQGTVISTQNAPETVCQKSFAGLCPYLPGSLYRFPKPLPRLGKPSKRCTAEGKRNGTKEVERGEKGRREKKEWEGKRIHRRGVEGHACSLHPLIQNPYPPLDMEIIYTAENKYYDYKVSTMFVCVCTDVTDDNDTVQQFSSTTTSTSTVNCSPRWIVYPRSRAFHAWHSPAATQEQCLQSCVNDASCVVVEWQEDNNNNQKCWIHNQRRERRRHNGIMQFEIVRRCNPESGT